MHANNPQLPRTRPSPPPPIWPSTYPWTSFAESPIAVTSQIGPPPTASPEPGTQTTVPAASQTPATSSTQSVVSSSSSCSATPVVFCTDVCAYWVTNYRTTLSSTYTSNCSTTCFTTSTCSESGLTTTITTDLVSACTVSPYWNDPSILSSLSSWLSAFNYSLPPDTVNLGNLTSTNFTAISLPTSGLLSITGPSSSSTTFFNITIPTSTTAASSSSSEQTPSTPSSVNSSSSVQSSSSSSSSNFSSASPTSPPSTQPPSTTSESTPKSSTKPTRTTSPPPPSTPTTVGCATYFPPISTSSHAPDKTGYGYCAADVASALPYPWPTNAPLFPVNTTYDFPGVFCGSLMFNNISIGPNPDPQNQVYRAACLEEGGGALYGNAMFISVVFDEVACMGSSDHSPRNFTENANGGFTEYDCIALIQEHLINDCESSEFLPFSSSSPAPLFPLFRKSSPWCLVPARSFFFFKRKNKK